MSNTYTHYPEDEISRDALTEELESRGVPTKIVYHFGNDEYVWEKDYSVIYTLNVTWGDGHESKYEHFELPTDVNNGVLKFLSEVDEELNPKEESI